MSGPRSRRWAGGGLTNKKQGEDEGELVDGVAQNVLHHGPRDEGLVAAVRLPQEQGLGGRLGGQRQRGERVHDEVYPEHLHGLQRGVLEAAAVGKAVTRGVGPTGRYEVPGVGLGSFLVESGAGSAS